MTKMEMIKGSLSLIVGFGAGAIIDNTLKIVKPKNAKGFTKVSVALASFVISMVAADKLSQCTETLFDKTEQDIRGLFAEKPEEESIEEEA